MTKKKTERKAVTLFPGELAVVQQVAKDYGQTFSGGLRFIINDWVRRVKEEDELRLALKGQPYAG